MSTGNILLRSHYGRLHTFYYYHYNVPIIATHCACVCATSAPVAPLGASDISWQRAILSAQNNIFATQTDRFSTIPT